jgi:Dolichyl-phosphate-mannose-protein mannosyltransferase
VTSRLLALLAANACFFVAGAGLMRCFGHWRAPRELPRVCGIAYMVGVAAVGVLSTLLLIAGLSLSVPQVLILCALLTATGLVRSQSPLPLPEPVSRPVRIFTLVAAGLLGVYLAALLALTYVQPMTGYDSWALWSVKSRALVLLDGLDPDVFANQAYSAIRREYPLFVPALEAIGFRFMRTTDTHLVHLQFAFVVVGFFVAAAQLLRDRISPLFVWPSLLVLAVAPRFGRGLALGTADLPLALFFGLAVLAGWRYIDRPDPRWLYLLATFAAAAALTKREGLAYVAVLFVALLLLAARRGRRILPLVAAGAVAFVPLGAWSIWRTVHDVGAADTPISDFLSPAYLSEHADRIWPALRALGREAFAPELWLLLPVLLLLAAALAFARGRDRSTAVFAVGLVAVLFVWIAWGAVVHKASVEGFAAKTAHRVAATPSVAAALLLPLLASALVRDGRARGPT